MLVEATIIVQAFGELPKIGDIMDARCPSGKIYRTILKSIQELEWVDNPMLGPFSKALCLHVLLDTTISDAEYRQFRKSNFQVITT